MAYAATKARTVLKRQTDAGPPAVYKQIEGLTSLGGPAATTAINETTLLAGGATIRSLGKTSYGTISFECDFDPADTSQAGLLAAIQSDTPTNDTWEIGTTLPSTPGLGFTGFVSSLGLSFPNTGKVKLNGAIQQTSDVTERTATAATQNPSYAGADADGIVWSWDGAEIPGVENFEITNLTRSAVIVHSQKDRAPILAAPSDSRKRGDFSFDILYDPSDTVHSALRASKGSGEEGALSAAFTDAANSTLSATAVITGWEHVAGAEANRIRVSGILQSNITIA